MSDYDYNILEKSGFKGKELEKEDLNSYINRKTTNILRDIFSLTNHIDLNDSVYEKFLEIHKKNEILEYKKFGLTSPQIYNIVYTYLVHVQKYYNKNKVINLLDKDVRYSKKQMDFIKHSGYTPQEFRDKIDNMYCNNLSSNIDELDIKFRTSNIIKADQYSK